MADEVVGKPVMVGGAVIDGVPTPKTQVDMTNHMLGRRFIRAPKNSLDKCTIISIFPREIDETKVTIEPGRFKIPAGSYEKPAVLVVGPSSWWKDYDPTQPVLEIPHGSIQVAESIVRDYCNGMFGCDMGVAMPGLFYVEGSFTSLEVKMKFSKKLDETKAKQDNWYNILVRQADALWARTNGNPLVIWDIMRVAAMELNLKEKPWLKDVQMQQLTPCKACGTLRNPIFPVCQACKAVDMSHPEAKNLVFAK